MTDYSQRGRVLERIFQFKLNPATRRDRVCGLTEISRAEPSHRNAKVRPVYEVENISSQDQASAAGRQKVLADWCIQLDHVSSTKCVSSNPAVLPDRGQQSCRIRRGQTQRLAAVTRDYEAVSVVEAIG